MGRICGKTQLQHKNQRLQMQSDELARQASTIDDFMATVQQLLNKIEVLEQNEHSLVTSSGYRSSLF